MAKAICSHDQFAQEDYIDIDPNLLSMSTSSNVASRRNSRDFEFKLCANPDQERCSDGSPADELFYKGIILPLQLHPRIQTIQRLLLREGNPCHSVQEEEELKKESMSTSCYAPEEEYEDSVMPEQCGSKNSWSRKFKGLGSSSLRSKLKASRAFVKSLFVKPTCSNDWCQTSKSKDCTNDCVKRRTKNMIGRDFSSLRSTFESGKLIEEDELVHRKSFSSAVGFHPNTTSNSLYSNSSPSSCSSSSSSSSSSRSSFPSINSKEFYTGLTQLPVLRRSSSVNSEMESSIQGAITYCKKSQDIVSGRRSVSNIGYYSL